MALLQRELDGLRYAVALWITDLQASGTADPLGKIHAFLLELFSGIEKSMNRNGAMSNSISVSPFTVPYRVELSMRSIIYCTIQSIMDRTPNDEAFKADFKAMREHLNNIISSMDLQAATLSQPLPGQSSMPITSGRPEILPLPGQQTLASPGPLTSTTATWSPFSLGHMASELPASGSPAAGNSLRLQTGPFSPSATTVSASSTPIAERQGLKQLRSPAAGDPSMRPEMLIGAPRRLSDWQDDPSATPTSAGLTSPPRAPPALLQFPFRLPINTGSSSSTASSLPDATVVGSPATGSQTHSTRSPPAPLQLPFRASFKSQSAVNQSPASSQPNPMTSPSRAVSSFFRAAEPLAPAPPGNYNPNARRDWDDRRGSSDYSRDPRPRSPRLPSDDVPSTSSRPGDTYRRTNDPRRPSRDESDNSRRHSRDDIRRSPQAQSRSYSYSYSYSDRRASRDSMPPPPPPPQPSQAGGHYYSSSSRDSSRSTRSRSQSTGHDGSDNEGYM